MEDQEKRKYERAKKRIKEIKGFYSHLTVYLIINTLLILFRIGLFQNGIFGMRDPSWSLFITPFFWGIGLAFHGLYVFQYKFGFFRNWEERKIKEYMEKEEEEIKRNNRWS